jgi:hypothetical protein
MKTNFAVSVALFLVVSIPGRTGYDNLDKVILRRLRHSVLFNLIVEVLIRFHFDFVDAGSQMIPMS